MYADADADADAVAAVWCNCELNQQYMKENCRCHYERATRYFIYVTHC